jgi:DNA-binding LacI/PurR family transcriptional regulator
VPLVHEQVRRDLRQRLGHDWTVGQRLPPLKALARQLGAGQSNTQRAVRQLSREGLLGSRRGRGTFVLNLPSDDAPPAIASTRQLAGKLVTLIRRSDDAFVNAMIDTIQQRIGGAGARVQVKTRSDFDTRGLARESESDAVALVNVMVPQVLPANPRQIVVIVDTSRITSLQAGEGYDHVTLNNEHGGFVAGCRLRQRGARSVFFVGRRGQSAGTPYDFTSRRRLEGLQRGFDQVVPTHHQAIEPHDSPECGARAAARYVRLATRPDAVFCASDELAVGFMHGALAHGLEAGCDYRIIGFDGRPCGRSIEGGPLTTVAAPLRDMGATAAQMLIERFAQPEQPVRFLAMACSILDGRTDGPSPPSHPSRRSPSRSRATR